MGEAVADEAELALLGVLLDGVEGLLLGYLKPAEPRSASVVPIRYSYAFRGRFENLEM